MTAVDGLEPTETRLLLCAAISLGDVETEGGELDPAWWLVYRETGRRYDRTTAMQELIREGWVAHRLPRPVLTQVGQAMLDEHGGKVLKRYRRTT